MSQIQQLKLGKNSSDTVKTKIVVEKKKIDPSSLEILRETYSRDSAVTTDKRQLKKVRQTVAEKKTASPDTLPSSVKDTAQVGTEVEPALTLIKDNILAATDSATAVRDTMILTVPAKILRKEGNLRNQINPDQWIWGIIITSLILFASTRIVFNKYLVNVFSSLFNYATSSHIYRERGYGLLHGAFRLDILFLLTITAYLYQLFSFLNIQILGFEDYKLFLLLLGFISIYTIIKFLVNRLLAIIAMNSTALPEIDFNKHLFFKALGVILLPLIIIQEIKSSYQDQIFMISSLIIITVYITSLARSLFIGFKKGVSIYYLILYLCTLEILPLLLIYKVFTKQV